MSMSRISFSPRFGNDMPEGCCDRRKRGEAVPCCAPYSPEELDTFRKEREAADTPVPEKKRGNFITRFFRGIGEWFGGLVRGIVDDLKEVGRKLTKPFRRDQ